MGKFHSIKLPEGWSVHHIDSNHSNNVVGNLLACPRKAHVRFHRIKGEHHSANLLSGSKFVTGFKRPDQTEFMRTNNPMKNKDSVDRMIESRKKNNPVCKLKGRKFTPEEMEEKYPRMTCPHCGLTGNARAIKQWHINRPCKRAKSNDLS